MSLLKDQLCPPSLLGANRNMPSRTTLLSERCYRWPSPPRSHRSRPAAARGPAHDRPDGRPRRVATAIRAMSSRLAERSSTVVANKRVNGRRRLVVDHARPVHPVASEPAHHPSRGTRPPDAYADAVGRELPAALQRCLPIGPGHETSARTQAHVLRPLRKETWRDACYTVGPAIRGADHIRQPVILDDQQFLLDQHESVEEVSATLCRSPLHGNGGDANALLATAAERTDQIVDERRLRTLRDLATSTAGCGNRSSSAMLTPSGRWGGSCPQRRAGAGQRPGLPLPVAGCWLRAEPRPAVLLFPLRPPARGAPAQHVKTLGSGHSISAERVFTIWLYRCMELASMCPVFRHRRPS